MTPPKPKRSPSDYALWAALPMAQTSQVESRLQMILDKTRNRRRLTRRVVAAALMLTIGLSLMVATAQTRIQRFDDKGPWAGKAYYALGNTQMMAGHYDDALASFSKAIALPEPPYANSGIHSSARYERINTLDFAGRYAEAVTETQTLLKNGGRGVISPDLWENLRERLPEFRMMRDYTDKQAQAKSFYAAFPAPADPRWTQTLPNGVTVQFVGCQQHTGNQHTAWTPDGKFLTQATFERNEGDSIPVTYSGYTADYVVQEQAKRAHGVGFALRLSYSPSMVVKATYALAGDTEDGGGIEMSMSGVVTENGVVQTDEQEINRPTGGLRLVSAHFPNTQKQTTLRVGIASGSPSALPPDAPNPAYQWAEFPNITMPPVQ